ncbi:hypothetical protein Tco_0410561 [Tanacetum coccineum]
MLQQSTFQKSLIRENPKGGDYPFDLSKPLPLITHGKRQRVPFEYFINNDLKYLQGGVSTMTYTTSTTKTKAAQYDLPGIEDKVMRKHGYGYLEEIVVRRADNVLYRFKEGRSLEAWVYFRTIEDLKLSESYQKKINVTKPDTTRPDLRKRHSYTLYKDPQGFIYVDDYKRNRLMRSDELYKFKKMEHIRKEKSSFHDQGHQQATKGKEDDKEFGEICWFDTSAGNPKKIILKLNLSDHRSILMDSKEYLKMVMERQSVKAKEIQERCIIKAFQDYQIKKDLKSSKITFSHSSQDKEQAHIKSQ